MDKKRNLFQQLFNRQTLPVWVLLLLCVGGYAYYLLNGLTPKNYKYFLSLRVNKALAILVVSYVIGYSSLVFQTITNNKILTPSIMGLDALYLFIQTIIVFFTQDAMTALSGTPNYLVSLGLMCLFSLLVNVFLFKLVKQNIFLLLLVGVILGELFGSLSNFMQAMMDPEKFDRFQNSMFASLSKPNEELIFISMAICAICFLLSVRDFKKFDVLLLGPGQAINLGINHTSFVRKTFVLVSVLISVATALIGPITFLGILVVSIARQMGKTYEHTKLSIISVLLAVFFMLYGNFIIEYTTINFTLSVIINFVGGIYFFFYVFTKGVET